jgi:hypothetical protein
MDVHQMGLSNMQILPPPHLDFYDVGVVVRPLRRFLQTVLRVTVRSRDPHRSSIIPSLLARVLINSYPGSNCPLKVPVLFRSIKICRYNWLGVMAWRAYAFTGKNKVTLLLLGMAYSTLLGLQIWAYGTHFICTSDSHLYVLLWHERD